MASFEQAVLKVQREKEFAELKTAVDSAFAPDKVEKLFRRMARRKLRVRDWDSVLARGVLDEGASRPSTQSLYALLPVSDQAQIREFYLFRVEEVSPKLRERFHKLYQYY